MDPHLRNLSKKRTANFREDETKLLIQLWGSPVIQNKLFLTHRKAPVMRLLAAHMQQRGFYRTPDEIKTRIRNLKCLYHRIKRSLSCGQGLGIVDPDWPHYKAMDTILSRQYPKRELTEETERILEGPKVEDIKQEIEDIDIHDDIESWATNESVCSDLDEEEPSHSTPPPLAKSSGNTSAKTKTSTTPTQPVHIQPKPMPIITPTITLPTQQSNNGNKPGSLPNMVPLLILNNIPQNAINIDKKDSSTYGHHSDTDLSKVLTELLKVQRETLSIEKQKLEIKRQNAEYKRIITTQLVQLVPMIHSIYEHTIEKHKRKQDDIPMGERRKRGRYDDDLPYEIIEEEHEDDKFSDEERDSGIQNDDASEISNK